MTRVTKSFRGLRAGDKYETDIQIGEECPEELLEMAELRGALETEEEAKVREKLALAAAESSSEITKGQVNKMKRADLEALIAHEGEEILASTDGVNVAGLRAAIIEYFWPEEK